MSRSWAGPSTARRGRVRLLAAAAGAAIGLVGCRPAPPPAPPAVQSHAERGPLRLTVSATPPSALIGDPVALRVEFVAPSEYDAQMPDEKALADLPVESTKADPPLALRDGARRWETVFVLAPAASGTLEIPPVVVRYGRRADGAGAATYDSELASDPIKVEIRSALTAQDAPESPRGITGVLGAPPRPWTWRDRGFAAAVVLGALVAAAAAVWIVRRLARRAARPQPPEDWALGALGRLAALGFDPARAREYYYQLTEIVRVYVERKFGLAAPERTTEEFLSMLSRDRGALPCESDRLCALLAASDVVKYAAVVPSSEQAASAMANARTFVEATAAAARRAAEEAGRLAEASQRSGRAA